MFDRLRYIVGARGGVAKGEVADMSIAARLFNGGMDIRADASPPGPDDDYWYAPFDGGTGGPVTADSAMRVSAVYACVTVITEDVASLVLDLMRRLSPTQKERAIDQPLSQVLSLRPNSLQTSFEWREMCQGHMLLRGDAFNVIQPKPRGGVELVPLHPDRVKVEVLPSRIRVYTYEDPKTREKRRFLDDEIFHLPGRDFDGVRGKSVIAHARESIRLASSSHRSANKLFDQGMKAPGILHHPGELSDTAYKRVRDDFAEQNLGGGNFHKPILLEDGMTWQSLGMTAQDAEFVATYKGALEDVARFFRMPPHKIGILDRATFSNIEHQSIDYVIGCLRAWLVRWQQRIDTDLISLPQLFAEFDDKPLLRGDMKSRYEAHAIGRQWGFENADEIRADLGQNPTVDGAGEDYWRPMNMARSSDPTPAEMASQRRNASTAAQASRAALFAESLAVRLVQRELSMVEKAAREHATDAAAWEAFLTDFYASHGQRVASTLHVGEAAGAAYGERQVRALRAGGVAVMETWLAERPAELVELALAS